jgi:hypothetical protein
MRLSTIAGELPQKKEDFAVEQGYQPVVQAVMAHDGVL